MKHILSILMLFSFVTPIFAATFVVDGIKYGTNNDGNTVFVNSKDTKHEGDIVIPATVTYEGKTYDVTSIGNSAFRDCSSLTSINIPDGVTSIGEQAFYGCSGLTSINIPDGVTSIGRSAFQECSSLTSVTIPDGVTSIEMYAFRDCSSLTSVTIGSGVTSIRYMAFYGCSGLTSINIPDGVTSIGEQAFYGCSGLTSITIGDGVTSIGYEAFYGCSGLTRVDYGGTIGDWVKINFSTSSNPLSYAHHLYIDGKEVTEVIIPDGVTSIGINAFYGCKRLISITIPESVTSIGYGAFYDCSGLTRVDYSGTIGDWVKINFSDKSSNPLYFAKHLYIDGNEVTDVVIPDGVTSIGEYAFYGCKGLISITIPESVTSIGEYAFYGCSGLTSINIPDGVTSIGGEAFYGCSSLTSINIPDGVTSIKYMTFSRCSSLTSITIPDGVTSIAMSAFYDCSSLTTINIPDGVTSIESDAFNSCSRLTSINIPDGVTSIGGYAFYGCSGLTSINIPDGVTSIGGYAFDRCSKLKQVVTENANVSMIKSALGTSRTYIVPCTLYEQYVAAGLTATEQHDLVKTEAVAATCTTDGNTEYYTCNGCSKHFADEEMTTEIAENSWVIAAVGHEWGSWKTTKTATCVAKGKKQRVCAHDASHVDVADIAINSNNHTNVVTDEAVAATCTETGLTEGSHCEACHATIVAQETIAALGHEWGSWKTTKKATCVAKGSKQRVCAHDASHVDVADIAINSNNHTNVVTDEAVAATCTETGLTEGSHCEACHATIVAQTTTDAIGHLFINYIYNNDATTEEDGTETAECDHGCGMKDTHAAEGTKLIPTGVGQVSGDSQRVIKTIEGGRVVIIRDGVKYDIMGRKLIEN